MRRQTFSFNFVFLFGGREVSAWSLRNALSAMITHLSVTRDTRVPHAHAHATQSHGEARAPAFEFRPFEFRRYF